MFNYGQYRVEVRHDGNSILNPNNSSDKSQWLVPRLIMIEENLGVFPKIHIEFDNFALFGGKSDEKGTNSSEHIANILDWEDLSIQILSNESTNKVYYESTIAVTDMSLQGTSFILKGVCGCTLNDLTEVGSSYLGNTLQSAINNLGMENKLKIVNEVSGLSGEEYFRFNETKVQCLLKLLRGAANYGTFAISRDAITIIDIDSYQSTDLKPFRAPNSYEIFSINNLISYKRDNSSSDMSKVDTRSNTENLNQVQEFTFDAYKDAGVPTVRENFYLNSGYISRNNVGFSSNYAANVRFSTRLDKLGTLTYNKLFDHELGDAMDIKYIDRLPYRYAIVVGKIFWFDSGTMINKILIGGVNGY